MSRVLIVEDEGLVLLLSEGILKEDGHETFTATDVKEATALIEAEPPFDLLFTDIHLKDDLHGGLELAQFVVSKQPSTRVLYTTGGTITDGMKSLFVEGADIISKPYTPEQMLAAVTRALTNETEAE